MKVKCDHCGTMVDERETNCPNCGAPVSGINRMAKTQPQTISDLKEWYQDHHLPPENITRFFIGKDIKEAKAFGIYQDGNGDFVVYKNKGNGERAIRYQGSDEAYAVNELYQRLKSEIADQKSHNNHDDGQNTVKKSSGGNRSASSFQKGGGSSPIKREFHLKTFLGDLFTSDTFYTIFTVILIFGGIGAYIIFDKTPAKGYYNYNNRDYYYQDAVWYEYDEATDDWSVAQNGADLDAVINSDTSGEYRIYDHEGNAFENTNWYDAGSSDDDDYDFWDSDSDWDSGDTWDSDTTDWDSDW